MSEIRNVTSSCLSKLAKMFNNLQNNTGQAMRTAAYLERRINESEKKQEEIIANPVVEEEIIPTGDEIRKDREEGEYR